MIWNTDAASPTSTALGRRSSIRRRSSKYKGQLSVYDDPIYIADAALYLKTHQPDLGIDNPYELDEDQFNAAVDLLKQQQPNVGEYWARLREADLIVHERRLHGRHDVAVPVPRRCRVRVQPVASTPASQGFLPEEGATGWSDTWMLSSEAS